MTAFEGRGARAHICVDLQRLFTRDSDWACAWMERIVPNVKRIAERHAAETIFTRFVPPRRWEDAHGDWRRYFRHWAGMTLDQIPPDRIDLVPALARFAPPAMLHDKFVYSPWADGALHAELTRREVTELVVTGSESDVCVLSTVLGAIDLGYHVVIVTDAVCGSADETHDAIMKVYTDRLGLQLTTMTTTQVLETWSPPDH